MHGITARLLGVGNHKTWVQIDGSGLTFNMDKFRDHIPQKSWRSLAVSEGDISDAKFFRGLSDSSGDLSAISDEYFVDSFQVLVLAGTDRASLDFAPRVVVTWQKNC